jgi:hypothetical protein
MEIDVTEYVGEQDCAQYSDSIANSGLQNIGEITWRNACEQATRAPLVGADKQDALRDWIRDFGAWDTEELAAMSDAETNALLLQFIAGDIREMEAFETHEAYQKASEGGSCSGRLFKGDIEGDPSFGRWYFYVGS